MSVRNELDKFWGGFSTEAAALSSLSQSKGSASERVGVQGPVIVLPSIRMRPLNFVPRRSMVPSWFARRRAKYPILVMRERSIEQFAAPFMAQGAFANSFAQGGVRRAGEFGHACQGEKRRRVEHDVQVCHLLNHSSSLACCGVGSPLVAQF